MQRFQKSRARKLLTAMRDSRLALMTPPQPDRAELARRRKNRIKRERDLASALSQAGIDLAPLRQLRPKPQDPFQRWRRHQAATARQSAAAARVLRRSIDSRRAILEGILTAPVPPLSVPNPTPFYVVLDTPFLITRTYGMAMDDWHVEPWNSWAKVRTMQPSFRGDGSLALSFYHVWQNPGDAPILADAHSYLVLNGGAFVSADGGIFPDKDRRVDLSIDVAFHPMEWWNQPPTTPPLQPDQSQNVMTLHAADDGWLGFGNEQEKDVFRGYDLNYRSWGIPPKATVVFETSLSVTFSNPSDSGHFLADFSGSRGQYSVMSAAVLLAISPRAIQTW